jgi:hypothetical protein
MGQEPVPWLADEARMGQRASHDDRERVAEVLRVAAGDGRLSLEELEERLEGCFAARTYGELAPLVADLPAQGVPVVAPGPVKDVARVRRAGGNVRYEGTWDVPRRLEVDVIGGNVLLDFTSAVVRDSVTHVEIDLRGGNLKLVVPDGYDVDANEVEIRGGHVTHRRVKDRDASAPLTHRIVVTGELTGGNVVVLPPRAPRQPGRLRRMLGRG